VQQDLEPFAYYRIWISTIDVIVLAEFALQMDRKQYYQLHSYTQQW
jgi:hypothetical protein